MNVMKLSVSLLQLFLHCRNIFTAAFGWFLCHQIPAGEIVSHSDPSAGKSIYPSALLQSSTSKHLAPHSELTACGGLQHLPSSLQLQPVASTKPPNLQFNTWSVRGCSFSSQTTEGGSN